MKKCITVAQIGCGKMSVYTMRYVHEKGGKIVCAYDISENVVGKDISEICGCGEGVKVENIADLEKSLKKHKPDVAIITTMSLMSDIYDVMKICAKCGVNAITTCEEAFDSYNSNPIKTKEIDQLAKKNNCKTIKL